MPPSLTPAKSVSRSSPRTVSPKEEKGPTAGVSVRDLDLSIEPLVTYVPAQDNPLVTHMRVDLIMTMYLDIDRGGGARTEAQTDDLMDTVSQMLRQRFDRESGEICTGFLRRLWAILEGMFGQIAAAAGLPADTGYLIDGGFVFRRLTRRILD